MFANVQACVHPGLGKTGRGRPRGDRRAEEQDVGKVIVLLLGGT